MAENRVRGTGDESSLRLDVFTRPIETMTTMMDTPQARNSIDSTWSKAKDSWEVQSRVGDRRRGRIWIEAIIIRFRAFTNRIALV